VKPRELRSRSLEAQAARRFAQNKLALVSVVVVGLVILVAVFAPLLTPYPYDKPNYDEVASPPTWRHPMGTDLIGRDSLSRVMYGARISISVGLLVQAWALACGMTLGSVAGYYGGAVDYFIMRLVDVMMAFPGILLVILIMVMLGPGLSNVLIALGATAWLPICRLTRAALLSLREQEFVVAARAVGVHSRQIILRHLIPNALSPIIVAVMLGIPAAIFGEAGLSFIGVGITPPTPSWGQMVGEYYRDVQAFWYLPFFPALMIGITMLSFTLVGDGLQDALNPRERR
jgi:oligopeptide transport system permease protein